MAGPGGHMFYIALYREKHEKIFLYEASPSEPLSIPSLFKLYPCGQKWPDRGSHVLHRPL